MRDFFFRTETAWILDMGTITPEGSQEEWLALLSKVVENPKGEYKATKRLAYKDGFYHSPRNDGGCYLPSGVTAEDLIKAIMEDTCLQTP